MPRIVRLMFVVALVLAAAPMLAAKCLDTLPVKGNTTVSAEADIVYKSSLENDPRSCTYGGNLVVRVKRGSALMSTFLFHDGEAVIVDWEHKRVSGRYTKGVAVDFAKSVVTVAKTYTRMELVMRNPSGGRERWSFGRELVPDAFDDTGFAFFPR